MTSARPVPGSSPGIEHRQSLPRYGPPGHAGTVNVRLVDAGFGAGFELVHGTVAPGGRAERHRHAREHQVIYVLEGLPEGFELKIKDDLGMTVFEETAYGKPIMAAFDADPARTYFVDIVGADEMIGQELNLQSQLFRNGVEQDLPQGP